MKRKQILVESPDTNCNDSVCMTIQVNEATYLILEKTINTQKEWYQFQTEMMSRIEDIRLSNLSRFKP